MNESTDLKFMSVVKNACCNVCVACSYPLVIFRVARFSAMYKQDLRARSEIALTNSGYSNGHISVEVLTLLEALFSRDVLGDFGWVCLFFRH
jgi:hypothetical protein